MSPIPGGVHARRLVCRALIVAGTTAAGTGATWLLGGLSPADAAIPPHGHQPAAEVSTVDGHAPGQRSEQHDPAHFLLGDLEPTALVDRSAHEALPTAAPGIGSVEHVADSAPVPTETAVTSADSGLSSLTKSLSSKETRIPSWSESLTPEPARAAEQTNARTLVGDSTFGLPAEEIPAATVEIVAPQGFAPALPATVLACTQRGVTDDARWADSHNSAGLGWRPFGTGVDDSLAGRFRLGAAALSGMPGPQPGLTPD